MHIPSDNNSKVIHQVKYVAGAYYISVQKAIGGYFII